MFILSKKIRSLSFSLNILYAQYVLEHIHSLCTSYEYIYIYFKNAHSAKQQQQQQYIKAGNELNLLSYYNGSYQIDDAVILPIFKPIQKESLKNLFSLCFGLISNHLVVVHHPSEWARQANFHHKIESNNNIQWGKKRTNVKRNVTREIEEKVDRLPISCTLFNVLRSNFGWEFCTVE